MSETERKAIAEGNAQVRAFLEKRFSETGEAVPYLKDVVTGRLCLYPEGMRSVFPMVYEPAHA